jgi:hypothetical protein
LEILGFVTNLNSYKAIKAIFNLATTAAYIIEQLCAGITRLNATRFSQSEEAVLFGS